ncbi:PQQ-binding-like beta-propeller repeat protein [bacterium]|nr:PQQ-binding-like beta-propeller repeat protein [bacterium]
MLRCCRLLILLLLLLGGTTMAWPQGMARGFHETVSIPVDAEAAKILLTIEDRWRDGRWADALPELIDLGETRGRSLVLQSRNDSTAQYITVQAAIDRLLAALPPEGLQPYRERINPQAELVLQDWKTSGDERHLQRLATQYFFSQFGDEACWELGQQAWWRGDLAAARYWWQQLLPITAPEVPRDIRHYPDSEIPAAEIAARLILCQMELDAQAAAIAIEQFRQHYPHAEGRLGHQESLWSDLLLKELRSRVAPESSQPPQNVVTFAGTNQRTLNGSRAIDLGGELWSVPLAATILPRPTSQLVFPPPAPLAQYPAIVDDMVYLNDGQRILGWELWTGRPFHDLGFDASPVIYPPLSPEPALPPRRHVIGGPLSTVTVGPGRLFARMGSVVTTPAPSELREQISELVCIDLGDGQGRLSWKLTAVDISSQLQSDDPAAPMWLWEGTPLLIGSCLYAALSRRRPQLEWCVVCLDAETGRLLWQQTAGISRIAPADHENLASHLLLTAGNDRLYLSTDWGAIFCLSQHQGQPEWAMTYQTMPPLRPVNSPRLPTTPIPQVLVGQDLFVAPSDDPQIFCLDATTGAIRWQQPTREPVESLLGVSHGALIGSGTGLWARDIHTGARLWAIDHDEPERQGYGRGWLAGPQVYWPTRESICVVDAATGRTQREQILRTPDEYRFGGHLVGYDGVLLVASSDRLTAYGEYARLQEETTNWLSQHPHDIRSYLKQGDLFAGQNQPAEAQDVWSQAQTEARQLEQKDWLATADLRRARDRWQEATGRSLREQFAQAHQVMQTPALKQRYLEAEWQQARTSEHRQAVLAAWLSCKPSITPTAGNPLGSSRLLAESMLTKRPKPAAAEAVSLERQTRTAVPVSYWRRQWQQRLSAQQSVIVPTNGDASSPVILISTPGEVAAIDPATGQSRWTIPHGHRIVSACVDGDFLGLVGPEELTGIVLSTGAVLWRTATPSARESEDSATGFQALLPTGLLLGSPSQGFWCFDRTTGDLRWHLETRPDPWSPQCAIVGRSLVGQSARTSQPIVVDLEHGHAHVLPTHLTRHWQRPPIAGPTDESFAVVTAEREIWFYLRQGQLEYRLHPLGSFAHADPWLHPVADQWIVLIDGLRLRTIDPRGRMSEPLAVAEQPLLSIPPVTLLADDLWLTCSAGMLRAFDPVRRHVLWEEPLLTRAPCRIISAAHCETILILPEALRESEQKVIEIWDARHGRRRQTFPWPATSESLQSSWATTGFILADSQQIAGYVPR